MRKLWLWTVSRRPIRVHEIERADIQCKGARRILSQMLRMDKGDTTVNLAVLKDSERDRATKSNCPLPCLRCSECPMNDTNPSNKEYTLYCGESRWMIQD